jgi:hypothetical protein
MKASWRNLYLKQIFKTLEAPFDYTHNSSGLFSSLVSKHVITLVKNVRATAVELKNAILCRVSPFFQC